MADNLKAKYAVDTSLFDALVEQASGTGNESAVAEPRALKQRLLTPDDADMLFLTDTLSRRLTEGHGEVVFEAGVDNGTSMDLSDDDIKTVTATLTAAADRPLVNAFVQLLYDSGADDTQPEGKKHARAIVEKTKPVSNGAARIVSYLVRRRPQRIEDMLEVRVAVVGNVDAGKSTMLGVLTQGALDDGRGLARLALFKHKHEVDTGRTSSVGMEILGFNKIDGAAVRHTDIHRKVGWDAVCQRSSKIVTFLDLAGHEKYLKTTVYGMAGSAPDYVMLMVAANAGVVGMAKEHLGLALALGIPVFVVVTKIDMCPPHVLDATLKQLSRILRSSGCRKLPVAVSDRKSVVMAASRFVGQRVCPVFQVSNVTGEGVGLLQTFLNILPLASCSAASLMPKSPTPASPIAGEDEAPLRYDINEIFAVPYVGTVVSGHLSSGSVRVGDMVWLGPDYNGNFVATQVRGIHRKRAEVECGYQGQSVSLALRKISRSQVRKGMVLLRKDDHEVPPIATCTFEAEVVVLYHSTTITSRYQAMLHCGPVRQTAQVLCIRPADTDESTDQTALDKQRNALRTGDRARVLFQFIRHPEYITLGSRLVFREGRTKGVGKVVRVLSASEERNVMKQVKNGTMVVDQRIDAVQAETIQLKTSDPAKPKARKVPTLS
ncbi:hypothetical protein IW139_001331 [Coemansia sp. RSA 353]|nr:hypothetical protein EV181_001046 [Coemansia sp. RSA 532]KAJ2223430.1 hypothetical protein EV180_003988 [Coemansia sp. RSA 518]KAJ2282714.1 hypothetical protein GGH14_001395 [Coemansia sp. RSA 370]KAJ2300060.1 hypothetical protein IW139_001331 [Coemansia sp. RSA 353]